ncbi:MAG: FecR family protein [Gammaproteobacteria bacterium]|nr:FecR family protein [Gammaproteobacteria bacterium]
MKNQSLLSKASLFSGILIALVGLYSANVSAASEVGVVDYVRGVVTAQHGDQGTRIMGKNAVIFEEDIITTAARSFAIVKMKDGTKITIRPNSSLGIDRYIARRSRSDSAVLSLFKGGIRAITGFISKNRDDAYQIKTPLATIGIRGTEFDARLCEKDCVKENQRSSKNQNVGADYVIGRVAFMRGQVSARSKHQKTRQIFVGGPLYEGDKVSTGLSSFAVIAFRDQSRVTLNADSEFEIKKHHYNENDASVSSVLMSLLRGGLRATSGLIGKSNPAGYKMQTPVATIGIRGTGYDIMCDGKCVAASPRALLTPLEKMLNFFISPVVATANEGMYTHVWDGAVELSNNAGSRVLNLNETAFLRNIDSAPIMLPEMPLFMRSAPAPRPDTVDVAASTFSQKNATETREGLYVSVYDGHVSMSTDQGLRVDLGKGEAGFSGNVASGQTQPALLSSIPAFLAADVYPRPESYSETWENLFNDVTSPDENKDFECISQ